MTGDISDQPYEGPVQSDLPPTDTANLDESIRKRLIVEIFHNMGCMANRVYYTKYDVNAEALDRDLQVWKEREKKATPSPNRNHS
jgi:hypothetical protein